MSVRAINLRRADRRLRVKYLARQNELQARQAWIEQYEAEEARQTALQARHVDAPPVLDDRPRLSRRAQVIH